MIPCFSACQPKLHFFARMQEKQEVKFRTFDGYNFFFDHVVQSSEILLRPDRIVRLVQKLGGNIVTSACEATHVVTRREMKEDIIKLNSSVYKNTNIMTWAEFYDRLLTRMDDLIDSLSQTQTDIRKAEKAFKLYMIEQDPFHETSVYYKQTLLAPLKKESPTSNHTKKPSSKTEKKKSKAKPAKIEKKPIAKAKKVTAIILCVINNLGGRARIAAQAI